MPLWQNYRTLTPRIRIFIGVGIMAYAGAGIFLSDRAEESLGFTPSEEDRRRLREAVPKIQLVDREEGK
ncbi:hypothetical protein K431DRAFT_223110 [Polychaeton citri CBS 116435]|uniref:Uncharacterized protein n=1 Tax=Polychaeton citri CBS 116435 TaxID=1314669 RepID=A0A9P4Q9P0_9PEZI|nr:hypothetical protein K431DRAFT_223110 [Polychaeton citri CBS 116435]